MAQLTLPQLGAGGRVLEAIATTSNERGSINIAPMGPLVDEALETIVLRPFRTSTTYHNLRRTGSGVLNITDDVLLFAQAAIGKIEQMPHSLPSNPLVLASACRWLEFEVLVSDDSCERAEFLARVVNQGHLRDFFGFNRAKHAIIEAAILATRTHLIPQDQLLNELSRLESPILKTGGAAELKAFDILRDFIQAELARN